MKHSGASGPNGLTSTFCAGEQYLPQKVRHLETDRAVPPKARELIRDLLKAGFVDRGGKGSHRNFLHPKLQRPVVISGNPGDDALAYQVRTVRKAIEESRQ
jgi:predicted RNA binding protein YcfA (HicA-like mRNA interferase family)